MSVNERLFLLESELGILATALRPMQGSNVDPERVLRRADFDQRFIAIATITSGGEMTPIIGEIDRRPEPTAAGMEHIASGRTLVSTVEQTDQPAGVFMTMALDPMEPSAGLLTSEVSLPYLWTGGVGDPSPGGIEVSVFDDNNRLLFSSFPGTSTLSEEILPELLEEEPIGDFEWS